MWSPPNYLGDAFVAYHDRLTRLKWPAVYDKIRVRAANLLLAIHESAVNGQDPSKLLGEDWAEGVDLASVPPRAPVASGRMFALLMESVVSRRQIMLGHAPGFSAADP